MPRYLLWKVNSINPAPYPVLASEAPGPEESYYVRQTNELTAEDETNIKALADLGQMPFKYLADKYPYKWPKEEPYPKTVITTVVEKQFVNLPVGET